MRSERERLLDLREAIERIEKYAVSREVLTRYGFSIEDTMHDRHW